MADYRCPNCAGYGSHKDDCRSGGIAAKARNALHTSITKALKEYWIDRRLNDRQVTLSDLQNVIDKAWQDAF